MTPPRSIDDLLRKAQGLIQANRLPDAAWTLRQAISEGHDDPRLDLLTARVAAARNDHAGAFVALESAIAKGFDPPPQIVFARIHALYTLGRLEAALEAIDAADAPAGSPLAHNLLGLRAKCLEREGDLQAFEETLDRLSAREGDSPRLERLRAILERRSGDPDAAIARLRSTLERTGTNPSDHMGVAFDLAKLLDRAGRYDEAFEAARIGNDLWTPTFDPSVDAREVDESIAAGAQGALDKMPSSTVTSDRPVFIVGMPRSGTSLLEQIVASHSQADGAGERRDPFILLEDLGAETGTGFPALLERTSGERLDSAAQAYLSMLDLVGARGDRVTNKALGLDRVVGFLSRLLPGARFLWIHRDERDAILSGYLHQIRLPWAWRLEHLAAAHESHTRLREHWLATLPDRSAAIAYESLVEDPAGTIDRVIEFLGLPTESQCHRFHESERVVLTPSHDQVRRPINRSGLDRWKHYKTHLGPILGTS